MQKLHPAARKIDTVFVVALLTLFAATASLLILIGARQYQTTTDQMNRNYEIRTAASYLTEKVRQYDTDAGIAVVSFGDGQALALNDRINNKLYTTYIYYYDGSLCELYVSENAVFTPGAGQPLIALGGFDAAYIRSGLIHVTFTDTEGTAHEVFLEINVTNGKGSS